MPRIPDFLESRRKELERCAGEQQARENRARTIRNAVPLVIDDPLHREVYDTYEANREYETWLTREVYMPTPPDSLRIYNGKIFDKSVLDTLPAMTVSEARKKPMLMTGLAI